MKHLPTGFVFGTSIKQKFTLLTYKHSFKIFRRERPSYNTSTGKRYALPLTYEGYERAKQILKAKYGKPSNVLNAFFQNIMFLPHIRGTKPSEIHDSYGKLASN